MLSSRNIHTHGSNRTRSGTLEEWEPQTGPPISRPAHLRSRSYLSGLSPMDPKPRNSTTFDSSELPGATLQGRGVADKALEAKTADQSGQSTTSSYLIPRIHFPGHIQWKRGSQDVKHGSVGSVDGEVGPRGSNAQLQLSHLGLHLPVNIKRAYSHRHTRSEIPRFSFGEDKMNDGVLQPSAAQVKGDNMLARMATNLSSRAAGGDLRQHHHKPHHQHSSSDLQHSASAYMAAGGHVRPGLRRRATSDPKAPHYHQSRISGFSGMVAGQAQYGGNSYLQPVPPSYSRAPPMTEVEILFYKAEKARQDSATNVNEADVQKITTQLAESNVELYNQLSTADQSARDMMRRLDYAHETLLRTSTSLVDTISSFQNLCEQSDKLIKNFESRTGRLDKDMRATLNKHRKALLDQRGQKVADLEERSARATHRAEEMSRRLDNCRVVVKNYTEREQTKRKAWKGVIIGSIWGGVIIFSGILLGLALWWYQSYGNVLKHDLHDAVSLALGNDRHGQIHEVIKSRIQEHDRKSQREKVKALENVPSDIRALLDDITVRHNGSLWQSQAGMSFVPLQDADDVTSRARADDDEQIDKIFDELEL